MGRKKKVAQSGTGTLKIGNTKSKSCESGDRYRKYVFTYNNYKEEDIPPLLQKLSFAQEYIFQEEIGEKGTKHLQGYVYWINARRFTAMKKIDERMHWEPCNNREASILYCQKPSYFLARRWTKRIEVVEQKFDDFPNLAQHKWQCELLKIIQDKPEYRKINWVWSREGRTGKTIFCRHLVLRYKALFVSGKKNDIAFALNNYIKENGSPSIVIFDFKRTNENFISYDAIECVLDGMMFSSKYESQGLVFNYCHVIVFANFEPITESMSKDRWNIIYADINNPPVPNPPPSRLPS